MTFSTGRTDRLSDAPNSFDENLVATAPSTLEDSLRPLSKASFVAVLLGIVLWVAHFWRSAQFGLYEDDWYRIPKTLGIGWRGLVSLIRVSSMPTPSQGRPLHPAFIYFFSFVGFKIDRLHGVYEIAFLVLLANSILFFLLLRRVFRNDQFVFLGSLAFVLFPADTTQPFLTHSLGVQPALALILIAFHFYLSGWRSTAYLAAFVSLFAYETPFMVFAAAPLLQGRPRKEWIKHAAILAAMLVGVVILRALTAESRVAKVGHRDLALGCLNIIVGPLVCLAMYLYRPVETLFRFKPFDAWLLALCWIAFTVIFVVTRDLVEGPAHAGNSDVDQRHPAVALWRRLLIGGTLLVLAYPLTLTTTGIAVAGRGTRVHTAAALGASVLCASGLSWLISRWKGTYERYAAPLVVSLFFTLLIGFGLNVQQDYVRGWQEQRAFWTDLVDLCPDLHDGTVILVEPTGLRDTRQLAFLRKNTTGVPDSRQIKSLDILFDVLPELYDFPAQWKAPPRVYRLPVDWPQNLFQDDAGLQLLSIEQGFSYFPTIRTVVASTDVIFLETGDGHLTRKRTLQDISRHRLLQLQDNSVGVASLPKTAIYPDVINRVYTRQPYLVSGDK